MSGINEIVVSDANAYIKNLLENKLPEGFVFHTYAHTLDVTNNAEIIAKHLHFKKEEMRLLKVSALFHDIGYIDTYDGHETASKKYAVDFLRKWKVDEHSIDMVSRAIYSTKIPQKPENTISEVLCDADLMYLSDKEEYFPQAELLRKEWIFRGIENLDTISFHANSLEFFRNHNYHTDYGKEVLQRGKEEVAKLIEHEISIAEANKINLGLL